MAWYDDKNKLTHVASYANEKEASRDANRAFQRGWVLQGASATDGHVNLRRTAAKYALFGPWGVAILGGSRTKGRLYVTYVRTAGAGYGVVDADDDEIRAAPLTAADWLEAWTWAWRALVVWWSRLPVRTRWLIIGVFIVGGVIPDGWWYIAETHCYGHC